MLRYKRLEDDMDIAWHGEFVDQFDNRYRRTIVWHPGFWWFVLRDPAFAGQRWRAFKHFCRTRREYLGGRGEREVQ